VSELHTDEPIRGDETSPDLLRREPFAKSAAQAVLDLPLESGFVLSIEGPWGYGKTSVLNLIERQLLARAGPKPILCTFNPWMIGDADSLAQSFLVQLASSLGMTDSAEAAGKAAKELLSYSTLFTALKFIPGAEPWATIVKDVFDAAGNATDKISRLKKLNTEQRRDGVVDALKRLGRRIVVFIDDLDRLPPREVFEMIRLIKAVGDFPCVAYVLCFDPSYIEGVLEAQQLPNAASYLDKVVQARLSLPLISPEDLLSLLDREFSSLPAEATKEYFPRSDDRRRELYHYGLRGLLETPRDIKRLFNRVRFVEPGCRSEVNLADLVALEVLALKAPTVYRHVRTTPAAYIGVSLGGTEFSFEKREKIIESHQKDREAALSDVPAQLRRAARMLVAKLFPRVEGDGEDRDSARRQRLVSQPECLAIALSAGLPSNETSYADALRFVADPKSRKELAARFISQRTLSGFLDNVRIAVEDSTVPDPLSFAEVLGQTIDSPACQGIVEHVVTFFSAPTSRLVWWVVETSLEGMEHDKRLDLIRALAIRTDLISLSVLLITHLHKQHGGFESARVPAPDRLWTTEDELAEIGRAWADAMVAQILHDGLTAAALAGHVYFRLMRFYPDHLKTVLDASIDDDAKFDTIFMHIGERGVDSVRGKYAKFDDEFLETFGGKERLVSRAKQRLQDETVTARLSHIYSAMTTGSKIYLADGSVGADD